MQPSSRFFLLAPAALLLASATLTGCHSDHGDPWVAPGQEQRIGDALELDEQRQQQLRDRAKQGQRQR